MFTVGADLSAQASDQTPMTSYRGTHFHCGSGFIREGVGSSTDTFLT